MKLQPFSSLRAGLALAFLFLAPACMSLSDYPVPAQLAGRLTGDTYFAPGGGWSVAVPAPESSGTRPVAEVGDAAPNARQTTLLVYHRSQELEWSVDVLDGSLPGEPALDADFMVGFFEWLATCDDAATPGARELRADRTETLDGEPARWLEAEPAPSAAADERGCRAVLVKRGPYWVACLVKYPPSARVNGADLEARLTELVRSFRVQAR